MIFTIGHSSHTFEALVALLRAHGVSAVGDVRSAPYSRRHPQFNREPLQEALTQHGIAYVFLGRELGGRPSDPACYEQGRVQYRKVARTPLFQAGIERALFDAETHRLALLCAEREPLECHRTLLVSRALAARGAELAHIHADGRVETHAEAMERLLGMVGMAEGELFRTWEERVAYVSPERGDPLAR